MYPLKNLARRWRRVFKIASKSGGSFFAILQGTPVQAIDIAQYDRIRELSYSTCLLKHKTTGQSVVLRYVRNGERQAVILASLRHPCIIPFYGKGGTDHRTGGLGTLSVCSLVPVTPSRPVCVPGHTSPDRARQRFSGVRVSVSAVISGHL